MYACMCVSYLFNGQLLASSTGYVPHQLRMLIQTYLNQLLQSEVCACTDTYCKERQHIIRGLLHMNRDIATLSTACCIVHALYTACLQHVALCMHCIQHVYSMLHCACTVYSMSTACCIVHALYTACLQHVALCMHCIQHVVLCTYSYGRRASVSPPAVVSSAWVAWPGS